MLYISLNVHNFTDQESNPVLIQSPHASPVHCTLYSTGIADFSPFFCPVFLCDLFWGGGVCNIWIFMKDNFFPGISQKTGICLPNCSPHW